MAAPNEEREMTIHQRGLVDTCFEEGQYEPGIAVLDQLRSSSLKPPADHIRQLLYIALFPPPPATGDQLTQHDQFPPSPAKGSPSKQKPFISKASLSPSATDSDAARRVLFSFLATNSPRSLFRALPRYPLDPAAENDLVADSSDHSHDQDSLIALESLCVKDCKNCWVMLKDGFIQRKKLLSQGVRKKRTRATFDTEDDAFEQGHNHDTLAMVAEHAWPILQWLLSLFEKDCQNSTEKFSLLLLSQIPPPRGGNGPRWDAGAPLDIVFHAINEDDGERRHMGIQLLTLLIHLTLSGSFDGPMFTATLTTRLYTSSAQVVQNLMESLPKTIPVLTFKITVCQRFLSSSTSMTGRTKPRPKPLPRRGTQRNSDSMASITDTEVGPAPPSRPAIMACSDVFQLLCSEHKSQASASEPPVPAMKYALLVSYALLQERLQPEERDGDWKIALSNGTLKHTIDIAFPGNSTYHQALTLIACSWQVA